MKAWLKARRNATFENPLDFSQGSTSIRSISRQQGEYAAGQPNNKERF
jgi:hypothetical protein